jgi:phospholipid/cholesterol/gamma-HCH transport system ATP-binding protein
MEKNTNEVVIAVKGLKKSFGEAEILKGIDFQVRKKENLVIIGKSGSGKSVTIKCIVGLITPDAGEISVVGKSMVNVSHDLLNEARKSIGFLFQSAALYDSMTVRENLEFPLKRMDKKIHQDEIDSRIKETLENVGLQEAIDKYPSELSGGMKKRAGLARTLVMRPEIMLYDEPTTGLDSITSNEISRLILDLKERYNTSSIIITHDMPCAKITADRIIILNKGNIIAEGSFDELSNSPDPLVKSFFHI